MSLCWFFLYSCITKLKSPCLEVYVDTAVDGGEAVEKYRENLDEPFDVIFGDEHFSLLDAKILTTISGIFIVGFGAKVTPDAVKSETSQCSLNPLN